MISRRFMKPSTLPKAPFIASWADGIQVAPLPKIEEDQKSRSVVILFGWLGSIDKHVRKFSEMYAQDLGMASIRSTISAPEVFRNTDEIESRAESICKWMLENCERKQGTAGSSSASASITTFSRVYLHAFSNGGGFVVAAILRRIYGDTSLSPIQATLSNHAAPYASLRPFVVGIIFDSCPIPLTLNTGYLAWQNAMPGWRGTVLGTIWSISQIFSYPWTKANMEAYHSYYKTGLLSDENCIPQLYMFGRGDEFLKNCREFLVDDLLKDKRRVHFLDKCDHCMLLVQSRPQYVKFCRDFIHQTTVDPPFVLTGYNDSECKSKL